MTFNLWNKNDKFNIKFHLNWPYMRMKIRSYFCLSRQCGAYLLRSSHAGQPCIILCMREFDWYLWLCPQCMQFARAERPCHQMSEDDLAIPKIWIELLLSVRTCTWPRNRFHFLLTGGKKTNIASPSPSCFLNSSKPDSLQIDLYRNWQLSQEAEKKHHIVASKMCLAWNYRTEKNTEYFHLTSTEQNG